MKLLPETAALVFVNVFDTVFTAVGIQLGYVTEGNPIMLWIMQHSGLMGFFWIKMLWLLFIVVLCEYSYQRLAYLYPNPDKICHNIRVIIRIGIVLYILWWSLGCWVICNVVPAYGAML